jgi:DNA-binding NarL/FixJ family response regulator
MALIIARDWRTRLVGEVGGLEQLPTLFQRLDKEQLFADLIVLDANILRGEKWTPEALKKLVSQAKLPKILCVGIEPKRQVLKQLTHPCFVGYILKDEICFSLAWAISLAIEGYWVITEGIQSLALDTGFRLPRPCLVLDGRQINRHLSERQTHVARLALMFSMGRHELADELGIGDWGYGLVSEIYRELGVRELLTDKNLAGYYFGNSALVQSYVRKIRKGIKGSIKARDMETLAFHMITMPEIRELK